MEEESSRASLPAQDAPEDDMRKAFVINRPLLKPLKPKPVVSEFEIKVQNMGGVIPKIEDIEISESLDEMYRIRKHYLIMTDAGKPVYTRYGDEMNIAPFIATVSAILPKIQSYFWDNTKDARDNHNRVHSISSQNFKIHLLKKGSLIYICMVSNYDRCSIGGYFIDDLPMLPSFEATQKHIIEEELRPTNVKEPQEYILLQLEYLHLQLMSVVTQGTLKQLVLRPNLDLKGNLIGLERTMDMMCEVTHRSPCAFLQCYSPLRLPFAARKVFNRAVSCTKRPSKIA